MSRDRRLQVLAWLGLVLLAAFYLSRLGGWVLQDPDEGRYAEIPREMIELGDWITPRLNYVSYFEKPPLLYWLVGLCFRTFGTSEWAARLTPAIAGIATVMLAYGLGKAMFGRRAALIGAALLATSPIFFVLSQVLVIDVLLTACFTATLAALWMAHRSDWKGRWVIAVAAAASLAVLAKGPVGLVLPGAIALLFLLWTRDWPTLRALVNWRPIAVFLALAAPWFVLVSIRNPEFPEFFFVREHLERFATDQVGHPAGPLYYLPILLAGPLPWTFLFAAIACTARGRAALRELPGDARLFLVLWFAGVVLFFSIASSKLAPYILPALPAAAVLGGAWLDRLVDDAAAALRGAARLVAYGILAIGASALVAGLAGWPLDGTVAARFDLEPADVKAVAIAAAWTGLALAATGAIVLRGGMDRLRGGFPVVCVLVLGMGLALYGAVGARAAAKTAHGLAAAIERESDARDRPLVVSYRRLMQSLSFYTRRRVTMVDPMDSFNEIGPGAHTATDYRDYFWSDIDRLRSEWSSGKKVFVATDKAMIDELSRALEPEPRVLARDGRRVLLVNFPSSGGSGDGKPAAQPAS